MSDTLKPGWRDAVSRAIAAQCLTEYRRANPPGSRRHKPYSAPDLARAMMRSLDTDDEAEGKRLLLLHRTGAASLA